MDNYLIEDEEYILNRYQTLLKKQNINTVWDLLTNYPVKYDDFHPRNISNAKLDEPICLEGTIVSKVTVDYLKSKLSRVLFQLDVDGKKIRCTVFNRVFLKTKLNYGSVIRVEGKFFQNLNSFTVQNLIILDEINREIVPSYKIKDVPEFKYLQIVEKCFRKHRNHFKETIPLFLLEKNNLPGIMDTCKILHFSDDFQQIKIGKARVIYEEFLKYQLSMKYLHYMRSSTNTTEVINYNSSLIDSLIKKLPFNLTKDQEQAIEDILNDLKKASVMNRLLQGEVGSGKTIVAIISMLACVSDNYQAALMCPTEILSKQHFDNVSEILQDFNVSIELLTGSTTISNRKRILEDLKIGKIDIIIGTHALFQKDVEYARLGIVIADEEHRFGVKQRVMIKNKGLSVNYLKMSATPIPRTLAISVYGDTDISVIKTMPEFRKKVITKFVSKNEKRSVIEHILNMLKEGKQVYVVTPLIEESESIDTANATDIFEKMKKFFNNIANVGLIHGKLKSDEKEQIMADFLNKKIDILVATSVIEVGVNVSNATTIVVLGAERFGVATLHQLRGRVMRSSSIPYCFFISDNLTPIAEERLKMVEQTTDGFKLAEYDLKFRGPGEFFGEKQSGMMNFTYGDIVKDQDILEIANKDSELLIKNEMFFISDEYKYLKEYAHQNYLRKINELD